MSRGQSPWLKRVLIPFWVLRLLFMIILIGLYAFAIAVISSLDENDIDDRLDVHDGDFESAKRAALGVLGAFLFFLCVCFLLDIVAIVLFARHSLRPITFLIFNVLQTLFWAIMLILSIIGAARWSGGLGIILVIVVFLLYLGLLIYASIIYHRERKGTHKGNRQDNYQGNYKQTPNPGNYQAGNFGTASHISLPGTQQEYYNIPPPKQPQQYYNSGANPAPAPAPAHYQPYQGVPENSYEMSSRPAF